MTHPYARAKVAAVSGTAASLDLSGKSKEIILSSTTDCWINFNSTAVANSGFYLPADTPVELSVGNKESVSVVQDSGAGYLSILEMGDRALISTVRRFFKSDSKLLKAISETFTGSSVFVRTVSDTFSGDSTLDTLHESSFSSDANIGFTVSASVTSDSNLLKEGVLGDTFEGEATLTT